jgi:hypothetical protein
LGEGPVREPVRAALEVRLARPETGESYHPYQTHTTTFLCRPGTPPQKKVPAQ